jgi:hypothetical protein
MTVHRQLLPENGRIQHVSFADEVVNASSEVVNVSSDVAFTREHHVIRQWAEARHAEPATGEATPSGPQTVHVNDGGAGVRFNFPGAAAFRPISWEEWFQNFDQHHCVFVFDNHRSMPLSNRYRIVNADEWKSAAVLMK